MATLLSRFGFSIFGGRRRAGGPSTVTLPQHLLNAPPVLLEGFEDHSTWTLVTGTKADDATNKTQGTNGLKLTTPANPFVAEVRKTLGTPVTPTTDVMWLDIFFAGDYGSRTITVSEYTTSARTRGRLYNLVVQQPGVGYARIPIRRSNPSSTSGGSTATDQIGQIEIRASGGAEGREFTLDNWQHSIDAVPVLVFCLHDNTTSQYETAFPLLTARKQRATLVTSTGGGNIPGSPGRMSWAQIREMHAAGHVSTNHTREHDAWQAVTVEADRIAAMQAGYDDLLANGIPSATARIFTYPGAFVWNASGLAAYRNSGLVDLGFGHNQLTQAPYPADVQNVGLEPRRRQRDDAGDHAGRRRRLRAQHGIAGLRDPRHRQRRRGHHRRQFRGRARPLHQPTGHDDFRQGFARPPERADRDPGAMVSVAMDQQRLAEED